MLLSMLMGCSTANPSSCDLDRSLIVVLPVLVVDTKEVLNGNLAEDLRTMRTERNSDNTRKQELLKQLDACQQ